MGFEYRLDFEVREPAQIDERLRGVAGFEGVDAVHRLYTFRRRRNRIDRGTQADAVSSAPT
ncbi:MAG TPA: hypothetical protein VIF57_01235 [Polyangia bacterium]